MLQLVDLRDAHAPAVAGSVATGAAVTDITTCGSLAAASLEHPDAAVLPGSVRIFEVTAGVHAPLLPPPPPLLTPTLHSPGMYADGVSRPNDCAHKKTPRSGEAVSLWQWPTRPCMPTRMSSWLRPRSWPGLLRSGEAPAREWR